ncbi:hypothetical protein P3342_009931 [Pyrenophora teres f. teres]|nr:hypothetical protein P3342_009931 [Pyrenophora teres f. teres]
MAEQIAILQQQIGEKDAEISRLLENTTASKQKVTVIIALQTKVTEVTLEAQTKEERDEYQEKFYATDSVNAELRDGIKIKLGLRKQNIAAARENLEESKKERDTLKAETSQLKKTTHTSNTMAHLKRGMPELESETAQLKQMLDEEKRDHRETKDLLRKEKIASDALEHELELFRKKLQEAETEYDDLAIQNVQLITEHGNAAKELENLNERYEKLQFDSIKNDYEVLSKTKELCVAKGQIDKLQKQLDEKLASSATKEAVVVFDSSNDAGTSSMGDEMEVNVLPAITDSESKDELATQSPSSESRLSFPKSNHLSILGTNSHRHRNEDVEDADFVPRGLKTSPDAPAAVILPSMQKLKNDLTSRKVKYLYRQELRLFEDNANGRTVVNFPAPECYSTCPSYKNEMFCREPLTVQTHTIPELKMSEEGRVQVAIPSAEACVKQLCPDLDTAPNGKPIGEVIVPEDEHELRSQVKVLNAVSGDEEVIPAATEQLHNASHTQASVYEADARLNEVSEFFDSSKAKPVLNASAVAFVTASVSFPKEPAQEKKIIASETDKKMADCEEDHDEAPKILVKQAHRKPIKSSKRTEKRSTYQSNR